LERKTSGFWKKRMEKRWKKR